MSWGNSAKIILLATLLPSWLPRFLERRERLFLKSSILSYKGVVIVVVVANNRYSTRGRQGSR